MFTQEYQRLANGSSTVDAGRGASNFSMAAAGISITVFSQGLVKWRV
jgi:hypothetical protein